MAKESIAAWLDDLGLSQYAEQFAHHDITLDLLPQLTDEGLKEIGVRSLGHRLRILGSIPPRDEPVSGAPAPGLAGDGERRQLTVMFCDLVGSTALSGRVDPERLRDVLGAYQDTCARTVALFEGHVAQYLGDGLMVYFGHPVAHEDDAQRAIRAGLSIVSRLDELTGRLALDQPLSVRIGIHTGLVVVGGTGDGSGRAHLALGATPNLAALAQALARPGTVVVSEATKRLVEGLFVFEDGGEHDLKSIAAPLHIHTVLGESRTHSRLDAAASSGLTPMIGREQEAQLLLERWAQAREGDGRVVLVSGDAGIGKSRLLHALLDAVADQRHLRLEFRCAAYYANSPLHPVIEVLPGMVGWLREDTDLAKWDKLDAFCELHGIGGLHGVPLLGAMLSLPASARFALPPMSPERQKQLTLQALLGIVLSLSQTQPVLLIVEDLHWMDPTTLELVTLLVNQVAVVPVMVVLTARLNFQPPWPAHAHVTPLVLTRLSRRQSEQFVRAVCGTHAMPDRVVEEIVTKTDGVPLFLEELSKMVLESGLLRKTEDRYELIGPLPPLAIPATLQDSLMARLDRLASAKPVAQLAATLGRAFAYGLLHAVSPMDEARLQSELVRLVDADLLHQRGIGKDVEYIFKHALIQEAAYQSLLISTRQQYHARIAQAMTDEFPAQAEGHPEIVAAHFGGAGMVAEAVQWWQRAGQHAMRRAAYREAITHYRKGLDALESMPASPGRDQIELALRVELGYALIPVVGWAAADAERAFKRAGELCGQIGDTPRLFRALWGLGAFHFVRGDQRRAREVAEQCMAVAARAGEVDASVEAHYLRGIVAVVQGDFAGARFDLEECVRLYGDERRPMHALLYGQDPKASAFGWLGMTLWTLGHPDLGLARARDALAFIEQAGNPFLLARGIAGIGFVHAFRREAQHSPSALESAIELCREQGFLYFETVVSAFQGDNLVHLGRIDDGAELMRRSLAALRAMGAELLFTLILANLARACLLAGKPDEVRAALRDGYAVIDKNDEHWAEAELYRIEGELELASDPSRREHARGLFEKALDLARRQQAKAYELRAAMSLVKVLANAERAAALRRLRALYDWFGEGRDTPDLREAKALLAQT